MDDQPISPVYLFGRDGERLDTFGKMSMEDAVEFSFTAAMIWLDIKIGPWDIDVEEKIANETDPTTLAKLIKLKAMQDRVGARLEGTTLRPRDITTEYEFSLVDDDGVEWVENGSKWNKQKWRQECV